MKTIELVKGIHSSVLGFGCAPILGAVSAATAARALDYAIDNGINHLDLARSYGYGEAEGFVGRTIKGKRDKIVLATKFGIRANWKATLLRPVKPLVRVLYNRLKRKASADSAPNENRAVAGRFMDRIVPLRSRDMKQSLENSLRALRTDYVDYLFIHEPLHSLTHFDELRSTAEQYKTEGKIRAWGLAFMQSQEHLHESYIDAMDLLQFNKPREMADYDKLVSSRGNLSNIIFSPMSGAFNGLGPGERLTKIANDFPKSVILCSMYNVEHMKQNIDALNNQ
jgi:aryl-alcohol dehydrogenase-like predicted oxidoreductase